MMRVWNHSGWFLITVIYKTEVFSYLCPTRWPTLHANRSSLLWSIYTLKDPHSSFKPFKGADWTVMLSSVETVTIRIKFRCFSLWQVQVVQVVSSQNHSCCVTFVKLVRTRLHLQNSHFIFIKLFIRSNTHKIKLGKKIFDHHCSNSPRLSNPITPGFRLRTRAGHRVRSVRCGGPTSGTGKLRIFKLLKTERLDTRQAADPSEMIDYQLSLSCNIYFTWISLKIESAALKTESIFKPVYMIQTLNWLQDLRSGCKHR